MKLEAMIETGSSYLKASYYAKKDLGFSISHTSIQRHYENHKLGTGNLKRDLKRPPTNTKIVDVDLDKIELNDDNQLKKKIIAKLRHLVDFKISEFAKGKARFPKEEGNLLNVLEKTYKDDITTVFSGESQELYYGPNDDFIISPGNENYTPEEFENYKRYVKMQLGLSTPKPTFNVIIEPPVDSNSE
jgi:hypothetical protein